MQLVQLGDATAEEKLTMLAHRESAACLEPEARAVLQMLCCGLVGAAPALATLMASPSKSPSRRGRRSGCGEEGDDGGEEQAASDGPAAPAPAAAQLLFQTSVTLPAAFFPPERFHVAGVSMPLDVFVGPVLPSEQAAANAASLQALVALHGLGIVVRYWPTRLLLAQHLLPRSVQPAAGPSSGTATPSTVSGPPAASTPGGASLYGGSQGVVSSVGGLSSTASFFCPLCNVGATGHKVRPAGERRRARRVAAPCWRRARQRCLCALSRAALSPPLLHPHRPLTPTCAASGTSGASARRSCCSRATRSTPCCRACSWRRPRGRARCWTCRRRCRATRRCRRWRCAGRTWRSRTRVRRAWESA